MTVAVVTGGGRGLCRAFAQALAADGWAVAVVARSAEELAETVALIERAGGRARAFTADVTDAVAVGRFFSEVERALGPVDLLVNNAGVIGPLGPFIQSTVADWWRTIEIDLLGQIICAHRALPGMIATARPHRQYRERRRGCDAAVFFGLCDRQDRPHSLLRMPGRRGEGAWRLGLRHGPRHRAHGDERAFAELARGKTWLPWFRDIFDEGRDLPAERPAALLLALASGRSDALWGRYVYPQDDLDRLVAEAQEIEEKKLYTLQVQRL